MHEGDQKEAYVLFGEVAAGKSTIVNALEASGDVGVYGVDRLLYEKHLAGNMGQPFDTPAEGKKILATGVPNLVVDARVRQNLLEDIRAACYAVTAVYLNVGLETRRQRFEGRREGQKRRLARMSELLGVDLTKEDKATMRGRSAMALDVYLDRTPDEWIEFYELLREDYLSGAHQFREEKNPDPLDFEGVDYVLEGDDDGLHCDLNLQGLNTSRVPFNRYRNERNGKPIELAIWDIGEVVYHYSLEPLMRLTMARTTNPEQVVANYKKFRFEAYMSGQCDFTQFCRHFCEVYAIPYSAELEREVAGALREGVRRQIISETKEAVLHFKDRGVRNVFLSNALPLLEEGLEEFDDIVPPQDRFLSFNTGLLKPDRRAYEHVLRSTGVAPENALFVDDKPKNVVAAIRAGVAGIRFIPETFNAELARRLPNTL